MSFPVGALVRHTHRSSPGEVRAVADGYAMVKWPDWKTPDLCRLDELFSVSPTPRPAPDTIRARR